MAEWKFLAESRAFLQEKDRHIAAVKEASQAIVSLRAALVQFRMHPPGSTNPTSPEEIERLERDLQNAEKNMGRLDVEQIRLDMWNVRLLATSKALFESHYAEESGSDSEGSKEPSKPTTKGTASGTSLCDTSLCGPANINS